MFSAVQPPLLFGLIAAMLTTLGLIAVALRGDWGLRYANVFTLIAAGLLTTSSDLADARVLRRIAPSRINQIAIAETRRIGASKRSGDADFGDRGSLVSRRRPLCGDICRELQFRPARSARTAHSQTA